MKKKDMILYYRESRSKKYGVKYETRFGKHKLFEDGGDKQQKKLVYSWLPIEEEGLEVVKKILSDVRMSLLYVRDTDELKRNCATIGMCCIKNGINFKFVKK